MVTPLGCGVDVTWQRLLAGESGARRVDTFDVSVWSNNPRGVYLDQSPVSGHEGRCRIRPITAGIEAPVSAAFASPVRCVKPGLNTSVTGRVPLICPTQGVFETSAAGAAAPSLPAFAPCAASTREGVCIAATVSSSPAAAEATVA